MGVKRSWSILYFENIGAKRKMWKYPTSDFEPFCNRKSLKKANTLTQTKQSHVYFALSTIYYCKFL